MLAVNTMQLRPLEFADCLADSPWFRQSLYCHENSLEETSKKIRQVEEQCRKLIHYTEKLMQAQKKLSETLDTLNITTIGGSQTEDEQTLAECPHDFARLITQIAGHQLQFVKEAEHLYLEPLHRLIENIGKILKEEKHKFSKESNKFYTALDKNLHLNTTRKTDFKDADSQLNAQNMSFCKSSLNYVAGIQSIQERLKFEFAEILSLFMYNWLSFYHFGHIVHQGYQNVYNEISMKVQKAKENYEATQTEADELKQRMLVAHISNGVFQPSGSSQQVIPNFEDMHVRALNSNIKQGYVYREEKSILPSKLSRADVLPRTWNKYYCAYVKDTKIFTMIAGNISAKTDMKEALEQSISFKLKQCIRRASDSIDKRFCFDVIPEERNECITLQALSEVDRRQWIDAMDGREPVYSPGTGASPGTAFETMLDESGFEFVHQCIAVIEEKGIREQGIYRNCGVTSKVQKLMQLALDKRKNNSGDQRLNLADDEWEIRTISSAVKTFLRNLPEPLMTFELHNQFINAAKIGDIQQRINHIHYYVYKLPDQNFQMLEIIIRHLRRVADYSRENLMTVGNIGVCFGPSLLRPKEETVSAIMDIKFCNVVVETLIANCKQVFDTKPPQQIGSLCPPKPSHTLVAVMPDETKNANQNRKLVHQQHATTASNTAAISDSQSGQSLTTSLASYDEVADRTAVMDPQQAIISPLIIQPRCGTSPRPKSMATSSSSSPINVIPNSNASIADYQQQQLQQQHTAKVSSQSQQTSVTAAPSTIRHPQPPPVSGNASTVPRNYASNLPQPHPQSPSYEFQHYNTDFTNAMPPGSTGVVLYSNGGVIRSQSSLSNSQQSLPAGAHISATSGHQQQNPSYHRASIERATVLAVAGASNNSSESLNSIGSIGGANDRSPGTQSISSGGGGGGPLLPSSSFGNVPNHFTSSANRSKLSGPYAPYAPSYNPLACENIASRLQKRHSGGSLLTSSTSIPANFGVGGGGTILQQMGPMHSVEYASSTLPTVLSSSSSNNSKQQQLQQQPSLQYQASTKIPSMYTNFINPNSQQLQPRRVRTLYPCAAGHETELSFEPGQIITNVYDSKEEGWLVGTLNGKTGLIPANYVVTI